MMKSGGSACRRCGRCCLANFAAYVTDEDLRRWKRQQRQDILHILERERASWQGDRLMSSASGQALRGCPFFEFDGAEFRCAIHETRPATCRRYEPGSSELCPLYRKEETR